MTTGATRALARYSHRLGVHRVVLYLACAVQGAVALWLGSRGWFSGDLIHYFVARGGVPGASEGPMEPHSAHWQLTLIMVYLVLFKLVGLTSYVPYLMLTVVVHLALVLVMHRLLRRLGTSPTVALVAAVSLLTYGAGSEAFIVEAPVALTSSLLLGALAVLALLRAEEAAAPGERPSSRSTLLASSLLLLACTISLGGVVASVWVGCFALSRGVWAMVRVVALPAVAFLGWYAVWGRGSTRVLLSREEVLQVPESAMTLLVAPLNDVTGGWGAGPALLLGAMAGVALVARSHSPLARAALAGALAAVFHAVVSAIAQLPYGLEQVTTSRYRYVVLVLLLPGLAAVLEWVRRQLAGRLGAEQRWPVLALAVVVAAMLVVHAALGQYRIGRSVVAIGDLTRTHLAGSVLAAAAGEVVLTDARPGSYISGEDLAALADPALAPERPDLGPTDADRLEAESSYYVAVTGSELPLAPPATLASDSFSPPLDAEPGCHTHTATNATPSLELTSYLGAGFRFRAEVGSVTTRLGRSAQGLVADPLAWDVEPGEWTWVATTAQVAELGVTFDSGGRYTFCFAS